MINDLANKEDMHKRSVATMDILPHLNYLASGYEAFLDKTPPSLLTCYVVAWIGR